MFPPSQAIKGPLLWVLLTSPLQVRDFAEISPGKANNFRLIPAGSTAMAFAWGVGMLCCLTQPSKPLIQFLFVRTNLRSPAYFSAGVAPNHLAAY